MIDEERLRRRIHSVIGYEPPSPGFATLPLAKGSREARATQPQWLLGLGKRATPWAGGFVAGLLAGAVVAGLLYSRHGLSPAMPGTAVLIQSANFISDQDGWVVTKRGLLVTRDGGRHWQLQLKLDWQALSDSGSYIQMASNESFYIGNEVTMVDALHIVILSKNNGARVLYSTVDGGSHWDVSIIAPAPVDTDGVTFFLDGREGWQWDSGIVYHTLDSGAHWKVSTKIAGEFVSSLFFTDARHGFIGMQTSADGLSQASLLVTQDAGASWQHVDLPAPPDGWIVHGNVQPSTPKMFGNRGAILVGGELVYTTTDGGLTWSNAGRLPGKSGSWPVTFLDANLWWTVVPRSGPDFVEDVYTTADAGASWQLVPSAPLAEGAPNTFRSITAVSPDLLWAKVQSFAATEGTGIPVQGTPDSACLQTFFGPDCSFLIRSTDGGRHWSLVNLPAA